MSSKVCLNCGNDIIRLSPRANNKKFCNQTCRNKFNWWENREENIAKQREASSRYAEGKIQCRLCDGWFVKPMSHAWQVHKMREDEYKEYFDLPLSKGIIPEDHRLLLSKLALENNMDEQLRRVGVRTRYKKGDPKAVAVTGWKGRTGSKGYQGEL